MRQRMIDAARELFVEGGYDAVTMRQIADRVEYTAPSLYFYFSDKNTLFGEVCRQDFRAFAVETERCRKLVDPIKRLRTLGNANLGFAEKNPMHCKFMFMTDHRIGNPEPRDTQHEVLLTTYHTLRRSVAESIARKLLKPSTRILTLSPKASGQESTESRLSIFP